MEAGEDYARRSARIKSLLASYYGEDKAKAGAPAAQASASNPGPSALDAPTFNAERHAAQVLKTYKLDRLVSEHGAIAADITQLHRQLQDVVYRNYAKFMDATDAVRTMKGTIEGMSGELGKLKGTIGRALKPSCWPRCP